MKNIIKNSIKALSVAGIAGTMFTTSVVAQSSPSDYTVGQRYNLNQQLTGSILPDPDGAGSIKYAAVRNTYNSYGQLTKTEQGELSSWQSDTVAPSAWTGFTVHGENVFFYDSYGRRIKTESWVGGSRKNVAQVSYDGYNRLECQAVRMNPAVFASLPASACTLSTEGADGPDRITKYTYTTFGRVTKVQSAFGTSLVQDTQTFTYWGQRKTSVTDARGYKTEYQYDALGRPTKTIYPNPNLIGAVNEADYEQTTYLTSGTAKGKVESYKIRNGRTFYYTYDNLGRVTKKDVESGYDTYYGYNNRGAQLYARFNGHSESEEGITNTYDSMGQLTSVTSNMDNSNKTISYAYNAGGQRTSMTLPKGAGASAANKTIAYTYDKLGRVKTVGGTIGRYTYNNKGQRTNYAAGTNKVITSYGFDSAERLSSMAHNIYSGSSNDVTYSYGRDTIGSVTGLTISNTAYELPPSVLSVDLDLYTANGLNQYTSITGAGSISHDAKGNMTAWDGWSYIYDDENKLKTASKGTDSVTYSYDPYGRLYKEVSNGTTTSYLYDGAEPVQDYAGSGSSAVVIRRYVNGAGTDERLAYYTYNSSTGAQIAQKYYMRDHLGSTVGVVSSAGASEQKAVYDTFGDLKNGSLSDQPFGYTGRRLDNVTGLYYYRARWYNPKIGRFMQTDPIGYGDGMNIYAYTGNNPMNFTDPSGLCVGGLETFTQSGGISGIQRDRDPSNDDPNECAGDWNWDLLDEDVTPNYDSEDPDVLGGMLAALELTNMCNGITSGTFSSTDNAAIAAFNDIRPRNRSNRREHSYGFVRRNGGIGLTELRSGTSPLTMEFGYYGAIHSHPTSGMGCPVGAQDFLSGSQASINACSGGTGQDVANIGSSRLASRVGWSAYLITGRRVPSLSRWAQTGTPGSFEGAGVSIDTNVCGAN